MHVFELTVHRGAIVNCMMTDKMHDEWIHVNPKGNGKVAVVALNEETAIFKARSRVNGHKPIDGYEIDVPHLA